MQREMMISDIDTFKFCNFKLLISNFINNKDDYLFEVKSNKVTKTAGISVLSKIEFNYSNYNLQKSDKDEVDFTFCGVY